MIKQIFD